MWERKNSCLIGSSVDTIVLLNTETDGGGLTSQKVEEYSSQQIPKQTGALLPIWWRGIRP